LALAALVLRVLDLGQTVAIQYFLQLLPTAEGVVAKQILQPPEELAALVAVVARRQAARAELVVEV
jgi:hypothetical protein